MSLSKKIIDDFKRIYKEKEGKDISDVEANEMGEKLVGLFTLLFDMAMKDQQKKNKLRDAPKGFPVDGHYSCIVCGNSINETNGWYDWYGNKCLFCQHALDTGVIPSFICSNRESYIKSYQLKSDLGLQIQKVKKYIAEGKLVAREILNDKGTVHEYIFLKKENNNLVIKFNPIRKSYDRHKEKEHRKWMRAQIESHY
jgi:hypothetical protein